MTPSGVSRGTNTNLRRSLRCTSAARWIKFSDVPCAIAATVPRAGKDLYATELPSRLVLILGAEGEGMSAELIRRANLRLTIPGTGAVESLNVSASAAVLFAEYWRQHH